MPKKSASKPKKDEYNPREFKRTMYLLSIATTPGVHDTIAPGLLGKPDYPVRHYGDVDQIDAERVDAVWEPPKASLATLAFPLRNTTSVRGSGVNDRDNRLVDYASTIERDLADVLKTDHRVAHFREQPEKQRYIDDDGQVRHHTFDFLVVLTNGEKIAIAVKDEERRVPSGIDGIIAKFREQRPDRNFADHFVVRTRKEITHDIGYNSRLILWARRLRAEADVAVLQDLFLRVPGKVVLSDVLDAVDDVDGGFVAAVNLLDTGHLINVDGGRFHHDSWVRFEPAGRV